MPQNGQKHPKMPQNTSSYLKILQNAPKYVIQDYRGVGWRAYVPPIPEALGASVPWIPGGWENVRVRKVRVTWI